MQANPGAGTEEGPLDSDPQRMAVGLTRCHCTLDLAH